MKGATENVRGAHRESQDRPRASKDISREVKGATENVRGAHRESQDRPRDS